jgi:hypothetical protein
MVEMEIMLAGLDACITKQEAAKMYHALETILFSKVWSSSKTISRSPICCSVHYNDHKS